MATETYKVARERLLRELAAAGWTCKPSLKVPHATSTEGVQVFFTPQAVHMRGLSLYIDIRGMTLATFVQEVTKTDLSLRRIDR